MDHRSCSKALSRFRGKFLALQGLPSPILDFTILADGGCCQKTGCAGVARFLKSCLDFHSSACVTSRSVVFFY